MRNSNRLPTVYQQFEAVSPADQAAVADLVKFMRGKLSAMDNGVLKYFLNQVTRRVTRLLEEAYERGARQGRSEPLEA